MTPVRRHGAEAVRKARKLARLLPHAEYRSALRQGVAAAVEHHDVPFEHDFATVLDVGAHTGQFALFARRRFPRARIVCFEPLPGASDRIEAVLGGDGRVRVVGAAAAASSGTATLHVARSDDASSLLPPAPPGSDEREGRGLAVRTTRLDDALAGDELREPCLLKVDVQGFELEVLRGAESTLPLVAEALVECSFAEFHAGQALADDVVCHLRERGLRLRGVHTVARDPSSGRCLYADLHFVRASGG